MSVSSVITKGMQEGSWIRRMFEEGQRLAAVYGKENVFDFSLGNPDLMPPPEFRKVLLEESAKEAPLIHCYMPNAGYADTRTAIAKHYREWLGLPFGPEHIVMTSGAGGGMNVALKSILEPGEDVIVLAPYFVEYKYYITNHGGRMVVVKTGEEFQPDLNLIAEAITPKTRAIIVNSPNNPTGALYPRETLDALGALLKEKSAAAGRPIYMLSDEPYRELLYDGLTYPSPLLSYPWTLTVTSNSKDLSLAGERIGHIAIHPHCEAAGDLFSAMTFCNRILGFVNANALMQRVVGRLQGARVETAVYQRRRDLFCHNLRAMGFEFTCPRGAFYLFPKSPMPDDRQFAEFMKDFRVIVVPGSGFEGPGFFRISFAVPEETISRSLEYFEKAAVKLGLKG